MILSSSSSEDEMRRGKVYGYVREQVGSTRTADRGLECRRETNFTWFLEQMELHEARLSSDVGWLASPPDAPPGFSVNKGGRKLT